MTTVPDAAPVVGAGIFNDVASLSAGLARDALLRSESGSASARPSNDSSGDSGPHRRSKRFLSYPRFVEVMLVADSKMVEHHGSNLQHYILTLMSIVSSALSHGFIASSRECLVSGGVWLRKASVFMRLYTYSIYMDRKQLHMCTKCMYLFCCAVRAASQSASLQRRAVGGKRAA